MSVKVEDIVTPKLAHRWAWHIRMAERQGADGFYVGRVDGFQEVVGTILGVAPELVAQILALPEFRDWWRDEMAPEELLAEALQKLVSLKRPPADDPIPDAPPAKVAQVLLDSHDNGGDVLLSWGWLVERVGRADAWGLLTSEILRRETGFSLEDATSKAHEIIGGART